ncbi:unnamed protein product [Linum trigynum]|uniref:Uncharacterized protein n=1 Tax=Linum trigynum TaxID=586398 RepID=A0AAV2EQZ6_9ROSI
MQDNARHELHWIPRPPVQPHDDTDVASPLHNASDSSPGQPASPTADGPDPNSLHGSATSPGPACSPPPSPELNDTATGPADLATSSQPNSA